MIRPVPGAPQGDLYRHILAESGAAILVISSELPELLLLSDRIAIVSGGRLTRTVENTEDLSEDMLIAYTEVDGTA